MNSCCTSRLGMVKASYESRDKALAGCNRQHKRTGDSYEPYECHVNHGRYHIRTIRVKRKDNWE